MSRTRTGIIKSKSLKFDVLNNVDYLSIVDKGKSLLEFDGNEVEGLSRRELQFFLGERLPVNEIYSYTIKFKNDNTIHTGRIRTLTKDKKKLMESTEMNTDLTKKIEALEKQIQKAAAGGGVSFDMLLTATKQGYEARIEYLNQKITDKDQIIQKIEREVNELENDLNECEKENAKQSGIAQYLAIGEKVLPMVFGKKGTPVSLKDSNTSDIPAEILEVLGVIDWTKINAESTKRIADQIAQYLSLIPKEYFKGA